MSIEFDCSQLLKARNGDENAVEEFFEKYKPLVKRLARGYYLVGGDKADLMQEGMIGLYKAFVNYNTKSVASFETYATVCVRRQIISAVRKDLSQKAAPLHQYLSIGEQGDLEPNGMLIISTDPNPEQSFLQKENFNELNKEINKQLSNYEKKVLKAYLSGKSYNEIAKTFDKTEKSVDNAILRIKKKLQAN